MYTSVSVSKTVVEIGSFLQLHVGNAHSNLQALSTHQLSHHSLEHKDFTVLRDKAEKYFCSTIIAGTNQ